MSEAAKRMRVLVVGATGLIGGEAIAIGAADPRVRILGLSRREATLPPGTRAEMVVADPQDWAQAIRTLKPHVVINALGTTWRKSGKSEEGFRAVDVNLVLDVARAAKNAGATDFIHVSSVGAAASSSNFYLKTKGEVEKALTGLKFRRLDIVRPGLLRGARGGDRRLKERAAIIASPLTDLFLHGGARKFRSIRGSEVATAAIAFAMEKAGGRFIHENDGLHLAAKRYRRTLESAD